MSDQTFEQLWKRLKVYAPEAPPALLQEFVNTAYSRALGYHLWTDLRRESALSVPVLKNAGTVTVTKGSTTVTGAGTAWTATDVGKQFFTAGGTVTAGAGVDGVIGPYYTITAVDVGGQILTLDRAYEKPDAAGLTYNVLQVYLEAPSDFLKFVAVRDIDNNWKLHTNFRQEAIDVWDAKRSVAGTSWILAAAPPRIPTTNIPVQRYELWPRTSPGPRTFMFRYVRKPPLLSAASDRPIFPIRGDVLRKGALAELAIWPGTTDYRNPYFSMDVHRQLEKEFQDGLDTLVREDNEISQSAVWYEDWEGVPYAPIDARYLQTHDIF